MLKRVGLREDPWGTPQMIFVAGNWKVGKRTFWVLSARKEECGDFSVLPGVWEGSGIEGAVDYGAELGDDDWAGLVEDVVGAGVKVEVNKENIVCGGEGVGADGVHPSFREEGDVREVCTDQVPELDSVPVDRAGVWEYAVKVVAGAVVVVVRVGVVVVRVSVVGVCGSAGEAACVTCERSMCVLGVGLSEGGVLSWVEGVEYGGGVMLPWGVGAARVRGTGAGRGPSTDVR
ncbi:hypothetical protein NDU88_003095 [Pleurodeles waltl]|uniref:Uncharacterized protein n=1 Tax=Pleurodeles waltl TaxID=8319 RepID=A0AAV7VET5_PLEWA|nr:hypothetical protein NDU88_003095 [Pleurodeles waltl]